MTRAELLFDQRRVDDALETLEQAKKIAPKLTSGLRLELRIRQKRATKRTNAQAAGTTAEKRRNRRTAVAEQLRLHANLLLAESHNGTARQLRDWWSKLATAERFQPKLAATVARKLLSLGNCEFAGKIISDTLEKTGIGTGYPVRQFPECETPLHRQSDEADPARRNLAAAAPNDGELLLALGRLCQAQE